MAEITPLLKQQCDIAYYNSASIKESYAIKEIKEEEPAVHKVTNEIPLFEIVTTLVSEWQRNGANEDLTPQDIMAMHIQYKRVTREREVLHTNHVIMKELADAMLSCMKQEHFYYGYADTLKLRHNILRNLRENWPSIIEFDENLAQNLNVYRTPTSQERIRNAWTNFQRNCSTLRHSISDLSCQILLTTLLLSWPVSMLVMGTMFTSHCSMDSVLPNVMVLVGVMGISAILWRLVLLSVEKWYWLPTRAVISDLWNVLKLVEFVFLLSLTVQLWLFFEDYTSSSVKLLKTCNDTFYTLMIWMNHISTSIAGVWIVTYFVKAVVWMMRIRYHYRPLFYGYTEMDSIFYTETGQ